MKNASVSERLWQSLQEHGGLYDSDIGVLYFLIKSECKARFLVPVPDYNEYISMWNSHTWQWYLQQPSEHLRWWLWGVKNPSVETLFVLVLTHHCGWGVAEAAKNEAERKEAAKEEEEVSPPPAAAPRTINRAQVDQNEMQRGTDVAAARCTSTGQWRNRR